MRELTSRHPSGVAVSISTGTESPGSSCPSKARTAGCLALFLVAGGVLINKRSLLKL